jgi:signal transduction histidine kinase
MLDEIYDSIDDGLDNQKGLIIQKALRDTSILNKNEFNEGDYFISEIPSGNALHFKDEYLDTSMYMQNEDDYEPVRLLKTAFKQGGRYYQLNVATSMVEEDDLVNELLYSIIWLYIGLVVSILFLNNFLLRSIWQPFYHLLKQLKHFRLDKQTPIVTKPTRVEEFRLLNESVQRLLQSNTETYISQKHFIENAAHELQTPLAITINKLETLAEEKGLTDEQLKLLASALDNLDRLSRLNKSLLMLSKIENRQFQDEQTIDMNEIVEKVTSDFSDQLAFSNITLHKTECRSCHVKMNYDLAVILITNLLKNAIIHNQNGGYINTRLDQYSFIIENSGKNASLDQNKIFSRFYTGTDKEGSTGLGLAIVKAIADLYHFTVEYHFNNTHSITIWFKKDN